MALESIEKVETNIVVLPSVDFEQLVVKVCLDCDSNTALGIWDKLSRGIEDLKKDLSPHEINVVDERLGLDCEW